jgi:hypothetical protein
MALAPLQLDYEELPPPPPAKAESSPAPVAPMAVSAGVPSPTSSSGMKRPQRAKCSVKRAKHTGFGSAPGSRVQSDIEAQVSSPPAPKPSRPGVSMARRSRLTRAGGGVSRAEVAARNKNDAPATFTPVNKQTLETGRPLFVDTDRSESPEPAQPTSRETNKPGETQQIP